MFIELVELGRRIRDLHPALRKEKCSFDIVIDELGNFQTIIPSDVEVVSETILSKRGKARFLLDKKEETFGLDESKHKFYINKLNEYADLQEVKPIVAFYQKEGELQKAQEYLKTLKIKDNNLFTFIVSDCRVLDKQHVRETIIERFEKKLKKSTGGNCLCSVCGSNNYPIVDEPHGSVKIPGGQPSGSMLVSYNEDAFLSYNLKGNLNSSICTDCASNYRNALEYLVHSGIEVYNEKTKKTHKEYHHRKNISEDSIIVFWTKEEDKDVDPFSDVEIIDTERLRNLINAVYNSQYEVTSLDYNYFYCFTMSSAGARIAVRDWIAISVEQYKKNIVQWFEDIAIVSGEDKYYPPMRNLINHCIKPKTNPSQSEAKNKSKISQMLWFAALTGSHIPDKILYNVLLQINHKPFFEDKAALIKVLINRNVKTKYKMKETLDEQNNSIAYLCGRVFALICKLQFKSQGGLNSSIKDRFFSACADNPARVMSVLLTKYVPIYQKKTKGAYNSKITELCARISSLPQSFSILQKGEFALGYYFQYAQTNQSENDRQ